MPLVGAVVFSFSEDEAVGRKERMGGDPDLTHQDGDSGHQLWQGFERELGKRFLVGGLHVYFIWTTWYFIF